MLSQALKKLLVLPLLTMALITPAQAGDEGGVLGGLIGGIVGHEVSNGRVEGTLLGWIFGSLIGSAVQDSARDSNLRKRMIENEKQFAQKTLGEDFDTRSYFEWVIPDEQGNIIGRGFYRYVSHGFYQVRNEELYCRAVQGSSTEYKIGLVVHFKGFYCKKDGTWKFYETAGHLNESFDARMSRIEDEGSKLRREKRRNARSSRRSPIGYYYFCTGFSPCTINTF